MQPYATGEQLGTYLGTSLIVPADAARLLVRASELINDHTITATYDVNDTGDPTDAGVIAGLRDATCAQVEYWLTGDEEDDIVGPLTSISSGGVQLQMGAGENRATPMYLAPRAARHLRLAGLLTGVVQGSG